MESYEKELISTAILFRHTMRRFHYGGKMGQSEFFMLSRILELTVAKNHWQCGYMPQGEDYEGISVTEIAAEFDTSMAATSKTLRSLEQKGWIQRVASKADRRKIFIYITEEGYSMVGTMMGKLEKTTSKIAKRIGEEDMKQLTELLSKMREAIQTVLDEESQDAKG